jgi:zinc protease
MRERLIGLRPTLGTDHATPAATPMKPSNGRRLNNVPKVTANSHAPALGDVVVRDLPNGSQLIIRPKPKLPLMALAAYGRAGVRFQPSDKLGVGTLTSRSLIKGTQSKSYREVADAIDHLGLTLVPFADRDTCGFYLETMLDHQDTALDLFAEILIHPSFPEEAVERERQLQIAQIIQEQDDTVSLTMDRLYRCVFGDHPYAENPLGTVDSVRGITRNDLAAWHRRFFVPENLRLAAVGDVDPDKLAEDLSRRLSSLGTGPKPTLGDLTQPEIPSLIRERIVREKEQSVVAFGMRAPRFLDDDRLPLEVLNRVLAGMGGRLWDELRETRHLCYMVGSFYTALDGGGMFGAYIGTSPDLVDDAIEGLEGELRRIVETPPTDEEFDRAINSLCGAHLIALQTNGAQAAAFARCEALGIGYERVLNFPERVRKVTVEDVQRVARQVIDLDRRAVVVLTPNAGE